LLGLATIDIEGPPTVHLGLLEEVRIWNIVRTAPQIAGSYNQFVPPTTTGLVGYWKFDEATAAQEVLDASPFGNHGTRGPDATTTAADPTRVVSTAPVGPGGAP
jgi:hypothetical protein